MPETKPTPDAIQKAGLREWSAVSAGIIGAFMAVLNIQITNSSLLDIEGGIGTGVDNGAWISTAYLIGEIIVIPLTDYLSQVFSFRVYLLTNSVLFLTFSAACAVAHTLPEMIAFRALQGFSGGVLIPMAFTLILTKLPKSQQPIGMALFALTATFAPAIGPTIGGYLTENYGWQYIFYINLVPGGAMIAIAFATLERQPMRLSLLKNADWLGILTMAIGLGCLQTVLEEGNKDDWFGSLFIVRLAVVAGGCLTAFVVIELIVGKPLVNLRLFAHRNFGFGTLSNMMLGFGLYGSVYLLPQYLGQVQGFNAEQIGSVMAWTGLPQLPLIPLVPFLMKKFDLRAILIVGLGLFSYSCFMNGYLSVNFSGDQMWPPNIVRAIGQALVMTPLTSVAMMGIAKEDSAAASGLFNMLRNLGGAFGTGLLETLVTKREQFHSNVIGSSVTLFQQPVRDRIDQLTRSFISHGTDLSEAQHQAVTAIGKIVRKQALIMGFADTFIILGIVLAVAAAMVLFTKKAQVASSAAH